MIVRELLPSEIALTRPIGEAFSAEAGVPFDVGPFEQCWANLYGQRLGVILGAFDGDDGPEFTEGEEGQLLRRPPASNRLLGSLGAVIAPAMFDGALVATEAWWYVHPEYRQGSGIGKALLEDFLLWATRRGAARVTMVHLANVMPDTLAALYAKLGFSAVETHYQRELR